MTNTSELEARLLQLEACYDTLEASHRALASEFFDYRRNLESGFERLRNSTAGSLTRTRERQPKTADHRISSSTPKRTEPPGTGSGQTR